MTKYKILYILDHGTKDRVVTLRYLYIIYDNIFGFIYNVKAREFRNLRTFEFVKLLIKDFMTNEFVLILIRD